MVKRGVRFKGLDDGPRNEVCKAELATAFECALPVDEVPVFFDHSNRYLALRSCDRNRQTRSHVLRNAGSGAAQRNQLLAHPKRLYFLLGGLSRVRLRNRRSGWSSRLGSPGSFFLPRLCPMWLLSPRLLALRRL